MAEHDYDRGCDWLNCDSWFQWLGPPFQRFEMFSVHWFEPQWGGSLGAYMFSPAKSGLNQKCNY